MSDNTKQRMNDLSIELMFSSLIKGKIEKEILTSGEDGYPDYIEFEIEESWLCGVGGGNNDIEGYDKKYDDWQWVGTGTFHNEKSPMLLKCIYDRWRGSDNYEIDILDGEDDTPYGISDFGLKYNFHRGWDLKLQLKREDYVECCVSGDIIRKSDALYNSSLDSWINREYYEGFEQV